MTAHIAQPSVRQRLLAPLNLAAYAAWAAVAIDVAARPFARPGGYLLTLLFLAAFVASTSARAADRRAVLWAAFAIMIGACFALLWLGRANMTPVLLILVAVVATLNCTGPWLAALMATLNALLWAILEFRWRASSPLQLLLVMGGFQLFAIVTVHALRRSTATAEELRRVNADLLATRTLLAQGVREAERLRLSRELHDVSGHRLTALKLHLTALARDAGPDTSGRIQDAAMLASELLDDIRAVVAQLRRHDGIVIGELLRTLASGWPSPPVSLSVADGLRVDDIEVAETLLRLAQEGLTNAARHAHAQRVWLTLGDTADALVLQVEDDGRGAAAVVPGLGLTGMRERVAALDGVLSIDASPRGGLRLTARLPRATSR